MSKRCRECSGEEGDHANYCGAGAIEECARLKAEVESLRVAIGGYRDSNLASLATTLCARNEALEAEAINSARKTEAESAALREQLARVESCNATMAPLMRRLRALAGMPAEGEGTVVLAIEKAAAECAALREQLAEAREMAEVRDAAIAWLMKFCEGLQGGTSDELKAWLVEARRALLPKPDYVLKGGGK